MSKVNTIITVLLATLLTNVGMASEPLNQLIDKAQREITRTAILEQQRLLSFQQNVAQQQSRLEQLQTTLDTARAYNKKLQSQLLEQQPLDIQLAEQLQQQSAELKALLNAAKVLAEKVIQESTHSGTSQSILLLQGLAFAKSDSLPSLQNLQQFWLTLLRSISADAEIQRVDAPVITGSGLLSRQRVTKVGPFALLDEAGNYLFYNTQRNKLQVIAALDELRGQADLFVSGQAQSLLVDPSGGELLQQRAQQPNLLERVQQGGIVGYVIIGLGGLGMLLAVWRICYIQCLGWSIARSLKRKSFSAHNPVGRLLAELARGKTTEQLELMADKQILHELPALERYQSFIKLLAAVAPLLGLLGTVTGMIATFASITLLGVSDPKLMAAGISQALITTVLGLCVAIPLLFAHSYLSARVRRIVQLLQHSGLTHQCEFIQQQQNDQSKVSGAFNLQVSSNDKRVATREVGHAAVV